MLQYYFIGYFPLLNISICNAVIGLQIPIIQTSELLCRPYGYGGSHPRLCCVALAGLIYWGYTLHGGSRPRLCSDALAGLISRGVYPFTGAYAPRLFSIAPTGLINILHSSLLTLHFKDSSLFTKEGAGGHGAFIGHITVVPHTGAALLGEHRLGALGILGEREVLVDTHHMGHALHIQVVGAY